MPLPRLLARALGAAWLSWSLAVALIAADGATASAEKLTARVTAEFDGITCEYSPGQGELARLLAGRLAVRNQQAAAALAEAARTKAEPAVLPLSPADLRQNRAEYLAAICAQLALAKPTPWQEECYEAFLNNYEAHLRLVQLVIEQSAERMNRIDKLTIWERADLVRRLEAGERINGFTYDPATKKGNAEFRLPSFDLKDPRLAELAEQRQQLTRDYQFRLLKADDGGTLYHASASSAKRAAPKTVDAAKPVAAEGATGTAFFPVILRAEVVARPVAEQAELLWNTSVAGTLQAFFDGIARMRERAPQVDGAIAGLLLHEVTEVGIVDHYYGGEDRRWFCDGVANYVPWRVARDRHGAEVAQQIYAVDAQLKQYADLAGAVDLRAWPASENQDSDEKSTRLNLARYAFAAQAIFLMHAQAGDEVLPRLFREIGRTKRDKVSFQTLEKAWEKVAQGKLTRLLAEAEKGLPSPAKP